MYEDLREFETLTSWSMMFLLIDYMCECSDWWKNVYHTIDIHIHHLIYYNIIISFFEIQR